MGVAKAGQKKGLQPFGAAYLDHVRSSPSNVMFDVAWNWCFHHIVFWKDSMFFWENLWIDLVWNMFFAFISAAFTSPLYKLWQQET